jgi:hypothetical protein
MGLQISASRRWLSLAAIAAAALLGAGCGGGDDSSAATKDTAAPNVAASDSGSTGESRETLELESQLSSAPQARGSRPGAQMVFTGMLFRPDGSSAIGRSLGSCTRTAPGKGAVYQCLLSFILHDGAIYAQSVSSGGGPSDGAVTGGTGSYARVHGTFSYKATGSPRVKLTMRYAR